MLQKLLQKKSLFLLLLKIEEDLADQRQIEGCDYCGGPLHKAFYERKPRGELVSVPNVLRIRRGLCCGRDGCRRRCLPPSVLFMGRRVYWGCVVLLVVAFRQRQPDSYTCRRIRSELGVNRQTIVRWLDYFEQVLPQTPWWQRLRGLVVADISDSRCVGDLLHLFQQNLQEDEQAVVCCLCFLTTGRIDVYPRLVMG